jgi:hypothetical protein
MAELSISISFSWKEEPGDCRPCELCKEPIYLKRFIPVVQIGYSANELKISFCESCYNLIENGDI